MATSPALMVHTAAAENEKVRQLVHVMNIPGIQNQILSDMLYARTTGRILIRFCIIFRILLTKVKYLIHMRGYKDLLRERR